jgi:hypothetical protein
VGSTGNFSFLPLDELAEVVEDERRADLFIGCYADPRTETLTLVRGDLRRLSVPVSLFRPSGTARSPTRSGCKSPTAATRCNWAVTKQRRTLLSIKKTTYIVNNC